MFYEGLPAGSKTTRWLLTNLYLSGRPLPGRELKLEEKIYLFYFLSGAFLQAFRRVLPTGL